MRPINLNQLLRRIELRYIRKAMKYCDNSRTQAAQILGIERTALVMKLAKFKLKYKKKGAK